jgi:hypothetical protein
LRFSTSFTYKPSGKKERKEGTYRHTPCAQSAAVATAERITTVGDEVIQRKAAEAAADGWA